MPESVSDRPTSAHSYVFLLAKQERYYYDADAIREPYSPLTCVTYPQPDKAARAGITTNGTGASGLRLQRGNGRNLRSVWPIVSEPFPEAHFATFPQALVRPCILAGSRPGDTVLDPFAGSGTTGLVAKQLERRAVGIELSPAYVEIAKRRLQQDVLPLFAGAESAG